MKNNKIIFRNSIDLKDGRTALSCGFGYNFAIQTEKGDLTHVKEKYYNKVVNSYRK